jgi:ParB family chromosome partitioning protein
MKHGLGRGFESLIPTDLLDESFDPTATQDHQVSQLREVKISEIVADPDQPRKDFEQTALEELAESIKEHGVVQPIVVTPFADGYQIVAGERRYRASILAGLEKIPAIIRTLSGQHKLEISLIENLQRQDLNVIETATAYLKLRDQFNMTLEQIGKRVGNRSFSSVSNTLRLLKLPIEIRDLLAQGKLSEGQARPMIGMDEKTLKELIPRILKEEWSARRIEQYIVDLKRNRANENILTEKEACESPYKKQLNMIKDHLKTEINIRANSKGAGTIMIKFKDDKDFERLQRLLS